MESSKIGIKLFTSNPQVRLEDVVPVFHSWIQQQALAGNLLIDVADYLHVERGPGIVLVAHEANYATDQAEPGLGLFYQRKRALPEASFRDRLAHAFREALSAAWLLEQDPKLGPTWKFDTRRVHVRVSDKLAAPNDPATFTGLKPELVSFFTKLLGTADFVVEHYAGDGRTPFEVRVSAKTYQPLDQILSRIQD